MLKLTIMHNEMFYHTLPSGEKAKFTIRDRIIEGEIFYYANVINIELDIYLNLSDFEKKSFTGTEITNGKGRHINYRCLDRLRYDIRSKYGREWLTTEK
jgi:hypothetical protein